MSSSDRDDRLLRNSDIGIKALPTHGGCPDCRDDQRRNTAVLRPQSLDQLDAIHPVAKLAIDQELVGNDADFIQHGQGVFRGLDIDNVDFPRR